MKKKYFGGIMSDKNDGNIKLDNQQNSINEDEYNFSEIGFAD